MGQPVVSAECIFQRILKAPITTYQEFFDDFDFLEKNSLKFFRLASVISPQVTRFVLDYGKLSASFGIHLDDAIQLLQSAGLHGDPVMADCITKRREQYAEISLACNKSPVGRDYAKNCQGYGYVIVPNSLGCLCKNHALQLPSHVSTLDVPRRTRTE